MLGCVNGRPNRIVIIAAQFLAVLAVLALLSYGVQGTSVVRVSKQLWDKHTTQVFSPSQSASDSSQNDDKGNGINEQFQAVPEPGASPIEAGLTEEQVRASVENAAIEHTMISSDMTADGNFFLIDFGPVRAYNPNIIPHPDRKDTYIVVARRDKTDDADSYFNSAIMCEATFKDSVLKCDTVPMSLPIASTLSPHCKGKVDFFINQVGPHDARIFYAPSGPYIMYGSQATHNCFGQWIQDLRRVVSAFGRHIPETVDPPKQPFIFTTELRRPDPLRNVEKNWFAFWDSEGSMYLHYAIGPSGRAFAKLDASLDGSVGEDLAPLAVHDKTCMDKYLPTLKPTGLEWMHQTTPSLSITLCSRSDPDCKQSAENTFIFTIFQHKTFYAHGIYEPYVMVFSASAPFDIYGISSKPFWIPGRGKPNGEWASAERAKAFPQYDKSWVPKHHSQMLFIVSMAWKAPGQNYHGFLDDDLFISFGVEDQASAGIVVKASDILANLNLCADSH